MKRRCRFVDCRISSVQLLGLNQEMRNLKCICEGMIMLDERKRQAILLLAENSQKKADIAELVGVSRKTIYNWLDDEEFVAELHLVTQRIQSFGENSIKLNLEKYIQNIHELARTADSEKVRLEANQYLVDRVLGKTTAKLSIDVPGREQQPVTTETIEKELLEIEAAPNEMEVV